MVLNTEVWTKMVGGTDGGDGEANTTGLIGEVVSWSMRGETTVDRVRGALALAGLDTTLARDFNHRNAFARACHYLEASRIIRKVEETEGSIHFQFTREGKVAPVSGEAEVVVSDTEVAVEGAEASTSGRYDYKFETILSLNKVTGEITCSKEDLRDMARESFEKAKVIRTANDVTCLVQRMFTVRSKTHLDADLFSIREQGSVYFVMVSQQAFLDQVQVFISAVGGKLTRFPVPRGTVAGDQSVQDTIAAGMGGLIAELNSAIASFDADTKDSTMERAAERINRTREKLDCYATYLGVEQQRLLSKLASVEEILLDKIAGVVDDESDKVAPTAGDASEDADAATLLQQQDAVGVNKDAIFV